MRRGVDDSAIETYAEIADIIPIQL